ncbi:MAG: SufD family Fe-S cluster assembly protein [Gammaproteobacteria bacterium]|nr:SufD family Fe-S cluster assembly protein [Gammaproteobacteria bacterium]
MTNLSVTQNTKQLIIQNGVLHSSSDFSNEIILDDENIIITPSQNSKIVLYFINNAEESIAQNIQVNFTEQNAEVSIFGLYQARNTHSFNIKTVMNHAVANCVSRQLWKGVMYDSAKVAFEGKIIVAPDAQKTEAHLTNKNLLLSKDAEVSTRPFLEIDANDVKCSHGATVGCLDNEAIFYLRSRGISENEARELLIEGFVNEILDSTPFLKRGFDA